MQHQSLQTVGSVINQSLSVVGRQGLLQSVCVVSLGEKDKFAVAARLIVVGRRLVLLTNLSWTYSDQLILEPTNLFPESEFSCQDSCICVPLLVCVSLLLHTLPPRNSDDCFRAAQKYLGIKKRLPEIFGFHLLGCISCFFFLPPLHKTTYFCPS